MWSTSWKGLIYRNCWAPRDNLLQLKSGTVTRSETKLASDFASILIGMLPQQRVGVFRSSKTRPPILDTANHSKTSSYWKKCTRKKEASCFTSWALLFHVLVILRIRIMSKPGIKLFNTNTISGICVRAHHIMLVSINERLPLMASSFAHYSSRRAEFITSRKRLT